MEKDEVVLYGPDDIPVKAKPRRKNHWGWLATYLFLLAFCMLLIRKVHDLQEELRQERQTIKHYQVQPLGGDSRPKGGNNS